MRAQRLAALSRFLNRAECGHRLRGAFGECPEVDIQRIGTSVIADRFERFGKFAVRNRHDVLWPRFSERIIEDVRKRYHLVFAQGLEQRAQIGRHVEDMQQHSAGPQTVSKAFQGDHEVVADLPAEAWDRDTPADGWSIRDTVGHLAYFDGTATTAALEPELFRIEVEAALSGEKDLMAEHVRMGRELDAADVLSWWRERRTGLLDALEPLDPSERLPWYGPPMGARSFATARLMETWAHGQAVFDSFGVARTDTDRIYSIAVLGVNTFGFNHKVNGLDVPDVVPRVTLAAPSGAQWDLGDPAADASITGSATEFCQVVTQTRNIADTDLVVTGDTAEHWMRIAQCFAGPPTQPPADGTRFLQDHGACP